MLTNMELYGTNDVPEVPIDVCNGRIKLLKERLAVLMSVHWMHQDTNTIRGVQEGITFWTALRDGEESYNE